MASTIILHKEYTRNEDNHQLKFLTTVDAHIPENDCVRLISQFVEEMDLTALYDTHERMPSEKHASPAIMLKILLYAYHERREISSRIIEKNCRRDINHMYLLEGRRPPDHAAVARFRTRHFAPCAAVLQTQMTEMLYQHGQVTDTEVFIDGTKIEAAAGRYTFVWKKAVTKHQKRFLQKTALLAGDIMQRYGLKPPWRKEVRKKHVKGLLKKPRKMAAEQELEFVQGWGHRKGQLQKDIEDLRAAVDKMKEYEQKLHTCGKRGSHSKTDPDATFMRMKEDHMKNGQLKPAYNLQHGVNSGFIVMSMVCENPTDAPTLEPFLAQMQERLPFGFQRVAADAGYESEENLKYPEDKGVSAYIKPSNYEQIGTKKFAAQIGKKENMGYDEKEGCYICRNKKKTRKTRTRKTRTKTGHERVETVYHCDECEGCPYREKCMPGKNWKRPVEERHKTLTVSKEFERPQEKEHALMDSEEGKKLRMNRSIQVEGSFGDVKGDSAFTRFLCRGKANVHAESVLFAMAHNLGWLHSRIQNDNLNLHLYELKESTGKAA